MEKEPFTTEGVTRKVAELYRLDQPALEAQASLIRNNIKVWAQDNFLLTTQQDNYLQGLNGNFLMQLTIAVSDSVSKREPISLVVSTGKGSKFFKFKKCLKALFNDQLGQQINTDLELSITYE